MRKLMGFILSAAALTGCGGTTAGNPIYGDVDLKSPAYSTSGAMVAFGSLASLIAPDFSSLTSGTSVTSVTEFKFCVTKLKVLSPLGAALPKDGVESMEASLGLIDVSSPSVVKTWGTVNVPVEQEVGEIDIELHKDSQICGETSSLIYNGTTLSRDLEFKFAFNPPIHLMAGDTLSLGLTAIATAIDQAYQAGKLTDELVKDYLTAETKGTGTQD